MALVRDPVTGQMYDDGRPVPVGNVATGLASLALGGSINPPALPPVTGGQPGRGDLQPTFAQRQGAYLARQAGAAADPVAQAGAIQAFDIAQRAVSAAQRPASGAASQALLTNTLTNGFPRGSIGAGGLSAGDQAVLTQDRANLQGAVDRLNTNFDTWRVPEPTAQAAQGGGAGGALMAADVVPTRGNYTQYNTDLDALRRRAGGANGIDLGAAALAAERAAPAPRGGLTVVGLSRTAEDMATSDNPFERRAGLNRMNIEAAQRQQQMANEGELARTEAAGRLGLQEANLRGQYGLQDTGLRGEYGLTEREMANAAQVEAARQQGLASLAAAEARAAGTVQAAQLRSQGNAGADALRAQEALTQQFRNAQIADALARNDMQTYMQLQFGRFAPQPQQYVDPLTGAPLSPEQIAALQQASLSRLNQ